MEGPKRPALSPAAGKRAGIDERPERPAGPCSIERQVSWLADHRLAPPSQVAVARSQWRIGVRLPADSCGGSCGFKRLSQKTAPHHIPFYPSKRGTVTRRH